jgi:hypothetical protein
VKIVEGERGEEKRDIKKSEEEWKGERSSQWKKRKEEEGSIQ